MSAKPAKKNRKARHKRKNPLFKKLPQEQVRAMFGDDDIKHITGIAGNLAITSALSGCTIEEKMLIAGLIPTFLKIVRSVPKKDVEGVLEKMYPPPAEEVPEA